MKSENFHFNRVAEQCRDELAQTPHQDGLASIQTTLHQLLWSRRRTKTNSRSNSTRATATFV
jgi:hypothetical protein